MTQTSHEIMEMVTFRPLAGVAQATVVERARDIHEWLAAQPGFVRRALVGPDETGAFVDVVHWRSLRDATEAGEKIMQAPCAAGLMQLISPESVRMQHLPVVASA